jgi:hypothetical protein
MSLPQEEAFKVGHQDLVQVIEDRVVWEREGIDTQPDTSQKSSIPTLALRT